MKRPFVQLARTFTSIIVGVLCVGPVLWFIMTGFITRKAAIRGFPTWEDFTLEHYRELSQRISIGKHVSDSLVIACLSTLLAVILALPCSYFISRGKGRCPRIFYSLSLAIWLVPPIALSLQVYFWYMTVGLFDSLVGLVVLHGALHATLAIVLLVPFFDAVPRRMDEVAWTDRLFGLSTLWYVVFPRTLGPIICVSAICFIWSWNELLFTSLLTNDLQTLPVAMLGLTTGSRIEWGQIAAAGTISMSPAVVMAVLWMSGFLRRSTQ